MKQFVVHFAERKSSEDMWNLVTSEEYDDRAEAMTRFFKGVKDAETSAHSISIVIEDRIKVLYDIPDEEIASFTMIVPD